MKRWWDRIAQRMLYLEPGLFSRGAEYWVESGAGFRPVGGRREVQNQSLANKHFVLIGKW